MLPFLICGVAVVLAAHWSLSYCRAIIWSASKTELSQDFRSLAAMDEPDGKSGAGGNAKDEGATEYALLCQLLNVCPKIEAGNGRMVRLALFYHSLLASIDGLLRRRPDRAANWLGQERRACMHFVGVALDRRIASTRHFYKDLLPPSAGRSLPGLARLWHED